MSAWRLHSAACETVNQSLKLASIMARLLNAHGAPASARSALSRALVSGTTAPMVAGRVRILVPAVSIALPGSVYSRLIAIP